MEKKERVPVNFEVAKRAPYGHRVYVLGNTPELGTIAISIHRQLEDL